MKWYPSDWLVNTRTLTLAAKGAWIDIVTALHDSKTYGKMTLSVEAWARVIGTTPDETGRVLTELGSTRVADVVTLANGLVMVGCRRMLREENAREKNRQRVAKHREAKDATPDETGEFQLSNDACNGHETDLKRGRGLEARDQIIHSAVAEVKKPKPRERDPLIDALASVDGTDPRQVPPRAWSGIGKSLTDIKAVSADVTPQEILRRRDNYRLHFPDIGPPTPHALAKHWGRCAQKPNGNGSHHGPLTDIYTEPAGWRERAAKKFPGVMLPDKWGQLSTTMRNDLIR